MDHPVRAQFLACFPEIKQEWLRLLHSEPVLSPLGRPETLVFLMDTTLQQLVSGVDREPDAAWLQHCLPVAGSVHRHCTCGLNPLLNYFATGELAVRAGAGGRMGEHLDAVLLRFRMLAQHEVESLCSLCRNRGGPDCGGHPPAAS